MCRLATAFILVSLIALPAQAETEERLQLLASASRTHDTNLFRLDENMGLVLDGRLQEKSDTISRLTAGVASNLNVGQQRFGLAANYNQNRFARFNRLDYNGFDMVAAWHFRYGRNWWGVIRQANERSLASFADVRGINGNVRDQQNRLLDLNWAVDARWIAGLSRSYRDLEYREPVQQIGDVQVDRWTVSLNYLTPKGNDLGFKIGSAQGAYPGRQFVAGGIMDDGYSEQFFRVDYEYLYSYKSTLKVELEYLDRNYRHLAERNFDAMNARAEYRWKPAAKVELQVSAWQRTNEAADLIANIREMQGASLNVLWQITEKVHFGYTGNAELSTFLWDAGVSTVSDGRRKKEADMYSAFNMGYAFSRTLRLDGSIALDARDSNIRNNDFVSNLFNLKLSLEI